MKHAAEMPALGQTAGETLLAATAARIRRAPTPHGLARRRLIILVTKWLLPFLALALLATIAIWPEFDRAREQARMAVHRIGSEIEGARLIDPHYRSVDEHGRPYTLTAATAQQVDQERVNLTQPKGDITLQNGTWLLVQAKDGVFMQRAGQLDLSHDVTVYRDDGTMLTTASAAVDLKRGAAASADATHVEGPFGTLDAQGFTVLDKGTVVQFAGPAHLLLNNSSAVTGAPGGARTPASSGRAAGPAGGTQAGGTQAGGAQAGGAQAGGAQAGGAQAGGAQAGGAQAGGAQAGGAQAGGARQ